MSSRVKYLYAIDIRTPQSLIRESRLIVKNHLGRMTRGPGRVYYRVRVPEDMELRWQSKDTCYTTKDQRRLTDLDYDIFMIMWDG